MTDRPNGRRGRWLPWWLWFALGPTVGAAALASAVAERPPFAAWFPFALEGVALVGVWVLTDLCILRVVGADLLARARHLSGAGLSPRQQATARRAWFVDWLVVIVVLVLLSVPVPGTWGQGMARSAAAALTMLGGYPTALAVWRRAEQIRGEENR